MPILLTQNGAELAWTPESVTLRLSRNGAHVGTLAAEPGDSAAEWYYDWQAEDYATFPGGYIYEARLVVVKPSSVEPAGPETVPTRGALLIDIAKAV